jgi:general secretion pathway protein D
MPHIKKLASLLSIFALLQTALVPLAARTKKGDRLVAEGRAKEARKDFDAALEVYEQALSQDPADPYYQLCADRARFQAAQAHVTSGLKIRAQGNLTQALIELQKAFQIDPSSSIAEMEVRRTQEMIAREKKKAQQPGLSPEEQAQDAGLTPAQVAKKEEAEKLARIEPVPELKPLRAEQINLVLRNQPPKVLFETVGKMAGINVLFDPDFVQQSTRAMSIEITNSTLEQALDYLAVLTRAFWKPLSQNTIFVTQENTTKRRDFEEQVMKVFYLNNINTPQELQEIVTTIRSVADLQRIFVYNAQNAIIARGEADRIALAEKIINDLDKPKSEVVVDIVVLQSARNRSRDLAAAVAQTGINIPITYNPGGATTTNNNNNNNLNNINSGLNGGLGGTLNTGAVTTGSGTGQIPLSRLGHISTKDYSVTLPGGLLEAMMSDSSTRILQSPQVRAVDGMKAVLKIGQKVPTASGSFQPGIGGVGINPLVNTQFTYIDVGVNVDMTPHIHDGGELDLHVEVEISSVDNHVNLGGIDQPVIGQRKVTHDIRMREGQVNLLGGLMQLQETKTKTGVPGISSVPVVGRLFSKESVAQDQSELLIALVPHIIRRPEITAENLRGIAVGNQTVVKLSYKPRPAEQSGQPAQPPATPQAAPAGTATSPTGTVISLPATPAPGANPPAPPPAPPPVAVPVAPVPAPAAPAKPGNEPPKASVMFTPPQAQTQVGGTVSLNFMVSNAQDFFSAPLTFTFDPRVVRLSDVIRGGVLSSDNLPPAFTKNIQNDTGTASVSFSRGFGMSGVTGNGILLTLVFQGVAAGSSTVTLPQVLLRNSKAEPIPLQTEKPPEAVITVR